MKSIRTYYDDLKVVRTAPSEVIRAAYKSLTQIHHPDKNPEDIEEAERIMKMINNAYDVLSDPIKRQEYDKWIVQQEVFLNNQQEKKIDQVNKNTDQQQQNTNRNYNKTSVVNQSMVSIKELIKKKLKARVVLSTIIVILGFGTAIAVIQFINQNTNEYIETDAVVDNFDSTPSTDLAYDYYYSSTEGTDLAVDQATDAAAYASDSYYYGTEATDLAADQATDAAAYASDSYYYGTEGTDLAVDQATDAAAQAADAATYAYDSYYYGTEDSDFAVAQAADTAASSSERYYNSITEAD